jgi:hypothetical protein
VPPELYTSALRAVLLEWSGDPAATLPTRLAAADSLASLFGVTRDLHEQLLCRALASNEGIVPELQVKPWGVQPLRSGRDSCA